MVWEKLIVIYCPHKTGIKYLKIIYSISSKTMWGLLYQYNKTITNDQFLMGSKNLKYTLTDLIRSG
jgi:hypothetical protein